VIIDYERKCENSWSIKRERRGKREEENERRRTKGGKRKEENERRITRGRHGGGEQT
jgi:hypothetical protein